jgi:hypothetical protein
MPPPNPDPHAGLPGIGYTAHDPVTGQPLSHDAYAQQSPVGQPVYQPTGPAGYPGGYPGQPGYPAVYPGYVQPGYGVVPMYGVPMIPQGPTRPGAATASAVLQFIQSAFVLIGGIYTIIAASLVQAISDAARASDYYYSDYTGLDRVLSSYKTSIIVVAVATIVAGGLLIAGGVTLLGRKATITWIGCILSLGISVYWVVIITQIGSVANSFLWLPIIYAILPIIALALALAGGTRSWAAGR